MIDPLTFSRSSFSVAFSREGRSEQAVKEFVIFIIGLNAGIAKP